jgi:DNA-binding response OmpR family regulator
MRILVVDDQADVRGTLAVILRASGHEVVEAEDGANGLREFADSNFDLTIVDFFLHGVMDGHQVIRSLRDRVPTLAVVAISGAAGLDFLSEDRKLQNVVCLQKPFRPDELLAAITAAARTA